MGKLGGQELNYSPTSICSSFTAKDCCFKEPPRQSSTGKVTECSTSPRCLSTRTPYDSRHAFPYRYAVRPKGGAAGRRSQLRTTMRNGDRRQERMMLIKARPVAGDESLASEFSIWCSRSDIRVRSATDFAESATKQRIETEIVRRARSIATSSGPRRHSRNRVRHPSAAAAHAGRMPFLQGAQTLTLQNLSSALLRKRMPGADGGIPLLREVEHRLQMENNLQTHDSHGTRHASGSQHLWVSSLMTLNRPSASTPKICVPFTIGCSKATTTTVAPLAGSAGPEIC